MRTTTMMPDAAERAAIARVINPKPEHGQRKTSQLCHDLRNRMVCDRPANRERSA